MTSQPLRGEEWNPPLKMRSEIEPQSLEEVSVMRFDDVKGREYCWDGTELYRMLPLKGGLKRAIYLSTHQQEERSQ